jgi:hypothetical protein
MWELLGRRTKRKKQCCRRITKEIEQEKDRRSRYSERLQDGAKREW